MSRIITVLGLVLTTIMLGTAPAQAADGTWTNNANGNWSTAANWNGAIADGAGSLANFSTIDLTASRTITLDSSRSIGRLLFGDLVWNNTGYDWTLSSSGGSILTLDNSGSTPTITVSNRTTTINSVLAGANGLNLNLLLSNYNLALYSSSYVLNAFVPGALTFTGSNTLSGALVTTGGTVRVGGSAGKFASATSLSVAGNGVFINGDATAASNNNVTNRIGAGTAPLTLGGGSTFTMAFPAAANTHTQTFASLTVNAGQNVLNTANTAAGTLGLAFTGTGGAGYVRNANGIVNVVSATGFTPSFANAPTAAGGSSVSGSGGSEILVGATLDTNDFIKAAAGVLGAATYDTTLTAGKNVNLTGDLSTSGSISVNSLRFSDATKRTLTIGASDTLTNASGGILMGPSAPKGAATAISGLTGGNLTSGTNELFFSVQNNTDPRSQFGILIGSRIVDNGAAVNLNITGNGFVLLANTNNSFTGNIYMNGGRLAMATTSGVAVTEGVLGGVNTIYAQSGFSYIRADLGANPWTTNHNISISAGAVLDICTGNGNPPITNMAKVTGSGVLGIGLGTYNGGNNVIMPSDENGFTGTYVIGTGLRANDGVGLSTNANLALAQNGTGGSGWLETSANFTRSLGTGANQVQIGQGQGNAWGGGFSAVGTAGANPITISLGGLGTPQSLTWGVGGFMPAANGGGNNCGLFLQDSLANNTLTWANPINNNGYLVYVMQNASSAVTNTAATMTGVISGSGGFSKSGAGLLILSASNTYQGATTVNQGTLVLTGNNTYQGQTTVPQGTLSFASLNSVVGGTASSNLGAPTNAATGMIDLGGVGGGGPNNANLTYTGAGETTDRILRMFATMGTITLNQTGTGLWKFTSPLVSAGVRRTTESTALILDGSTAGTGELAGSFADGMYTATVVAASSGASQLVMLTGDQNYGWARPIVWVSGDGIAPGSYWTAFSGTTGTLNQVTTAGLTNGQSVFFRGTDSLSKTGSGTWTLSGANTYSGGTTISGGTLQIGAGGASGTIGLGPVTDNAALVFNRSDNVTVSNNIAGTGSLTVAGTGTTTLLGTNTYSGATVISNGTLQVGNGGALVSLGSGPVTNNGTLVINHSDSVSFDHIQGTGNLTQAGSGTLSLFGDMNYSGAITINGGTLNVAPTPSVLTNSLAWFDAGDAGTMATNASGQVTNWVNKGTAGSALDATNIVATAPTLLANGLNGKPVLWLKANYGLITKGNLGISGGQDRTMFVVGCKSNNTDMFLAHFGVLSAKNSFGICMQATTLYNYLNSNDITFPTPPSDVFEICDFMLASSNGTANVISNGVLYSASAALLPNTTDTQLYLGSRPGSTSQGKLAEVIVFNRALTTTERNDVRLFLKSKWFPYNKQLSASKLVFSSGGTLNLGGNGATVTELSGSGVVTNGSLTVTGTLAPGGTNAIGTLTVMSNLTVGANTVVDWNFNDTSNDVIAVGGALTVPAVATVNVSRVSGTLPVANPAVLFSATGTPTINGAANLNQWVILGTVRADTRAVVRGNQVQLVRSTGMLLEIY